MPAQPTYNYADVGTGGFDPNDPSVMGRVTQDTNAASTNEVNIWMRGQPWYQAIIAQHGGSAGSDAAKSQIIAAAQKNGVQIDQSNVDVDDSGNLQVKGMSGWEKGLIIAGVAAATIATMGAAGVFDAAAAAGAEGAGDAAAIDAGASAAADAGITGAVTEASTTGSILAGTDAATAIPGGLAASAAADAPLAALPSAATMAGDLTAPVLGASSTGGISASTLGQVAGALGKGIGAASTAAGNNQLNQEKLALDANAQNITGNTAATNNAINVAKENATQQGTALSDVYRNSQLTKGTGLNPYGTAVTGLPSANASPAYLQAASELEQQGLNRIGPSQTGAIAPAAGYTQIPLNNVQGATGTSPSTLQQVGQYAGPALSTIGAIAPYL